ncbi:hypothetical protein [Apibacter sp. ESL0404]|uniref:hypothetical protein n=1 Tax=Apibacter sp. ESL0404 TaxID=2704651 RepID=UPI001C6A796A|nr:hypothetical protein [Apibacter sp. ESL0404]QYN50029.1 hypothetical protein GYM72_00180 [Apibacter sp. ESL0404]
MKINLIIAILIVFLYNCNEDKISYSKKNKTREKSMVEERKGAKENRKIRNIKEIPDLLNTLRNQVKIGANTKFFSNFYSKKDFDVLVSIEEIILKSSGFEFPNQEIFDEKIKSIFGKVIDSQSENSYLKISSLKENDKSSKYQYDYSNINSNVYIVDKKNFITSFLPLPYILDYQNIYRDIPFEEPPYIIDSMGEITMTLRWKDIEELPQQVNINQKVLISRNKYLFNDDSSQFSWLIKHDSRFMRSLVIDFGYTEDKKLLKWVIENTKLPNFYKHANDNDLEELGKLLWTKDYDGNVHINQNTLDVFKELSTPNKNLYIMYIAEYLANKLEHEKELNISLKAKIAAYLLYWGESFKYDKCYNYNQMFMGHFYRYKDDGRYEKEFKKNNYYGLHKFKEWYEASKREKNIFNHYDYYLEGVPQPIDYYLYSKNNKYVI